MVTAGAPVVVPMYVAPPLPVASFGLYFGTGISLGATFGGGGYNNVSSSASLNSSAKDQLRPTIRARPR